MLMQGCQANKFELVQPFDSPVVHHPAKLWLSTRLFFFGPLQLIVLFFHALSFHLPLCALLLAVNELCNFYFEKCYVSKQINDYVTVPGPSGSRA